MLFDFVRAAFTNPQTACTNLSRRLRDGVSLFLSLIIEASPVCRRARLTLGNRCSMFHNYLPKHEPQ